MTAIKFRANVRVLPGSKIVIGQTAWAPNLLIGGSFYPGRILFASRLLGPGEEGIVTLGMLVGGDQEAVVNKGTRLELRDGPFIKIADARVI